MMFVRELNTVMGLEAQAIWRRFVEKDEEIFKGERGAERRQQEIEARRILKHYRAAAVLEHESYAARSSRGVRLTRDTGASEPFRLSGGDEAPLQAALSEYVTKLEMLRAKPGEEWR